MTSLTEIRIEDEHTFNNWGLFNAVYNGNVYHAKWDIHNGSKVLSFSESEVPSELADRVREYLFG